MACTTFPAAPLAATPPRLDYNPAMASEPAQETAKNVPWPRRIAIGLALVLGSLGLAFLVLESGFRILDIQSRHAPLRQVEIQSPDGSWKRVGVWGTAPLKQPSPIPAVKMGEFVPNRTFRFLYYEDVGDTGDPSRAKHAAVARINALGLRGRDFPMEKPANTSRILFVGDSFTFGEGVQDDETFASVLQERLRSEVENSERRYQVINAGVSGYNTKDEVLNLRMKWLDLEPDTVVLVFYLNDAYDESRFAALITGSAEGELGRELRFESRSRLLQFVADRVFRWRTGRRIAEIYQTQFFDDPAIGGHDWEACKKSIRQASELMRERGIRFAVVIFPELHALDESHPFQNIYQRVHAYAESLGIPALNLFPAFEGRSAPELWVHVTDHHPNPEAHRIAADAIWSFLHDPENALLK
jgi:lysophospholipase L1-like esterase